MKFRLLVALWTAIMATRPLPPFSIRPPPVPVPVVRRPSSVCPAGRDRLVLFFLFRTQLSNIFGDLFDRIADAIAG